MSRHETRRSPTVLTLHLSCCRPQQPDPVYSTALLNLLARCMVVLQQCSGSEGVAAALVDNAHCLPPLQELEFQEVCVWMCPAKCSSRGASSEAHMLTCEGRHTLSYRQTHKRTPVHSRTYQSHIHAHMRTHTRTHAHTQELLTILWRPLAAARLSAASHIHACTRTHAHTHTHAQELLAILWRPSAAARLPAAFHVRTHARTHAHVHTRRSYWPSCGAPRPPPACPPPPFVPSSTARWGSCGRLGR